MGEITKKFGELVFNQKEMQERLSLSTYKSYMETLNNGAPLNEDIAEDLARAIKEWALESMGNGVKQFKYQVNSQTSATSDCR